VVMRGRHLVTGYTWSEGDALLYVRQGGTGDSTPYVLEGRVCFRITQERRCVGFFGADGFERCPDARTLSSGSQCDGCVGRDRFRACMICDGSRCPSGPPDLRARCDAPHILYLACFGDDTIKVGTASLHRRRARIVEQGPLAAVRIAQADGPTIKQMERILSQGEFVEVMRRAKKTELLGSRMTEEEALAQVLEAASRVPTIVPLAYRPYLHAPQIVDAPEFARASRGRSVRELPVQAGTVIEGSVVGAVGHVLFVEDETGCFALDLGALKARVLEFEPTGPKKRPVVQLGLF